MGFNMRALSKKAKVIILSSVLAYVLAGVLVTPELRHRWWYLQENVNRSFSGFCALTAVTAVFPWCAPAGFEALRNIRNSARSADIDPSLFAAVFGTDTAYSAIDARGMTFGGFKSRLEEFRGKHGGYLLWSFGRHGYCLTPRRDAGFDKVLDAFADEKLFSRLAQSRIYSPAGLFACYVGSDAEVDPAFADITAYGGIREKFASLRTFFRPVPTGSSAPLDVSRFTPFDVRFPEWLKCGNADAAVFLAFEDGYENVQEARREALLGFNRASSGMATNALACWARAAKVNPRDPLLLELADAFDNEAKAHLAIGNVNGALKCYENRIEVFPQDVAAIHNFGVCMKKAGHPELAARVFAKAVELDPLHDAHRLELIDCAEAGGHPDVAVRQIDVLLKRRPDDLELKKRRARILVKQHLDRQRKVAEEKAKTSPARYLPENSGGKSTRKK